MVVDECFRQAQNEEYLYCFHFYLYHCSHCYFFERYHFHFHYVRRETVQQRQSQMEKSTLYSC